MIYPPLSVLLLSLFEDDVKMVFPIKPPSIPSFFRLGLGVEMGPTNQPQQMFMSPLGTSSRFLRLSRSTVP